MKNRPSNKKGFQDERIQSIIIPMHFFFLEMNKEFRTTKEIFNLYLIEKCHFIFVLLNAF